MDRARALLTAAGIDPRQGPAEAAALMVRSLPLKLGGVASMEPEECIERGWCAGVEAFAEVLSVITAGAKRTGTAFGGRWPWFDVAGTMVSPGLPVRVALDSEEPGPDGVYSREGSNVFREAAGRRTIVLSGA